MSSSLPDGFTLREATDTDAAAVADLMNAVEAPLGGDAGTTAEDVRHYWRKSSVWLVEDGARVVGSLETFTPGDDWLSADVFVHPDVHGRGIGAALVRLSEDDARRRGFRRIRNGVLYADSRARELLERAGYAAVRHFYRMRIDLNEPPPDPVWPEGARVEPFELERDGPEVHAAIEEAFADAWGHVAVSYNEWIDRHTTRSTYDPSLWIVVREGRELTATTVCDTERFGMGWIGIVAVRTAWRRRGLGRAMLHEAFRRFFDRGERVVGLGVDAENPDATRLYERAGMSIAWQATVYEKEFA